MALLEVEGLTIYFHSRNGVVKAVDDVTFSVDAGETLAIVGESGSGKSVTCYSLLDLLPKSQFLARAGIRGIYSDYINSVPIRLVMDPYAGLSGAGYSALSRELSHRTITSETA